MLALSSDYSLMFDDSTDTALLSQWKAKGNIEFEWDVFRETAIRRMCRFVSDVSFCLVCDALCDEMLHRVKRPAWVKFCQWQSFNEALQVLR
jgi:hypothetical protein